MPNRTDRKTLKEYFQTGKVPTGEHFSCLIDSFHNFVDDGVALTDADRVILYPKEPDDHSESQVVNYTRQTVSVIPDGNWHNLPVETGGCCAYRIITGYTYLESGVSKLMEVRASQCNGSRRKLSGKSRLCGLWLGKIMFRWHTGKGALHLQVRCRYPITELSKIECQVEELWRYK